MLKGYYRAHLTLDTHGFRQTLQIHENKNKQTQSIALRLLAKTAIASFDFAVDFVFILVLNTRTLKVFLFQAAVTQW